MEVARLLLEANADKDQAVNDGATPLFIAAQQGHLEVARLLLEANADKDQANENGTTPLFIAAQQGHLEVPRLLLGANADKDKAMNRGATPSLQLRMGMSRSNAFCWMPMGAMPKPRMFAPLLVATEAGHRAA